MPAGKHVSKQWKVVVDSKDLSDHAFRVAIADEKEKIDVSGFSAEGVREYLQGLQDQSIVVSFLNDFGSGSVFQTLQPLYASGSIFPITVQPYGLGTAAAGADNPICSGSAQLYTFPVEAELNARAELEATFAPAPNSQFTWGTA